MTWQWHYDWDGSPATSDEFASQGDAETWLGEHWQELLESGVPAVTLVEEGRAVYGPMSLAPE